MLVLATMLAKSQTWCLSPLGHKILGNKTGMLEIAILKILSLISMSKTILELVAFIGSITTRYNKMI